jgi:hypothetical protein
VPALLGGVVVVPPPPQALHNIKINKPAPSSHAARRFLAAANVATLASPSKTYSQDTPRNPVMLGGRNLPCGGTSDGAVVETATATVVDAVPFNVTVLGVSVQVDSEGAPVHVRFTVSLNPPWGASVKE